MTEIPCENCGTNILTPRAEKTTKKVTMTDKPVFRGRKGETEMPARECPECGEVTAI